MYLEEWEVFIQISKWKKYLLSKPGSNICKDFSPVNMHLFAYGRAVVSINTSECICMTIPGLLNLFKTQRKSSGTFVPK